MAEPATARTRPAVTLVVLLAGTFMTSMDAAIANVAGPSIQESLHMSGAELQLVISGYTVAYAALLVTGARLGDDLGYRRLFRTGVVVFTVASLACGLAWSPAVLIAARVAQGIGAAALAPQVVTMIQLQLGPAGRARAVGIYASVISTAAVTGQLAGGLLISANLAGSDWRPVFLINVPAGVALTVIVPRAIPALTGTVRRRQDPAGVVLLSVASLLVLIPLVFGSQAGWPGWAWGLLAAAVPVGWAMTWYWRRQEAAGGEPLFRLSVLRYPGVRDGMIAVCTQMLAYAGFLFAMTLFLQRQHHYSPVESGLTFGPYAASYSVVSATVGRLRPAIARWVQLSGLIALAAANLAIGLLAARGHWPAPAELTLLVVAGAGFGAGFSPAMGRVVARVPPDRAYYASGLLTSGVQLSFVLGVATLGSYYLTGQPDHTGRTFAVTMAVDAALAVVAAVMMSRLNRLPPLAEASVPPPARTPLLDHRGQPGV